MSSSVRSSLPLRVESLEGREVPATLVGLTPGNKLVIFDSASPTQIDATLKITGLAKGEDVVSLDARPATGELFGVTDGDRLYTIDPRTGAAVLVFTTPFAVPTDGSTFGLDFNPTVDRIRFVTNNEQNLRLNPITGAVVDSDVVTDGVQGDTNLAYAVGDVNEGANPFVADVAYTNNFAPTNVSPATNLTTLFAFDAAKNTLVRIGGVDGTPSPNGGQLSTVGALGQNIGPKAAFDIDAYGNAFAAVRTGNGTKPTQLATVDLASGALTLVGKIGTGKTLLGLTALPRAEIGYAVTADNRLVTFNVDTPETLRSSVALTGLTMGETITGLDYRPATGHLFALSTLNRVLLLNPVNGQAIVVGTTLDNSLILSNSSAGLDFNPTVDRLRLVSQDADNLRYNPVTSTPVDSDAVTAGTQGDGDLNYFDATDPQFSLAPSIVAVAYDRNDNDLMTATTLFALDSTFNTLVRQGAVDGSTLDVAGGGSPNSGNLRTIGALGVDITTTAGFDISGVGRGSSGTALAALQVEGETTSTLFHINTGTGLATRVGTIGGGQPVTAFTLAPPKVSFSSPAIAVSEKAGTVRVLVTRTGGAEGAATVTFSMAPGTATAGSDYTAVADTTVTFAPGETRKFIDVAITKDKVSEADETIYLNLAALTGTGNAVQLDGFSSLTITDDD